MKRGLGHLPNPPDARDKPVGALLQLVGAASPVPPTASLRGLVGAVRDQQTSSACVAFANCKGIFIRGRFTGVDVPELSPLASYALTRGVNLLPGEPLVDIGSIPRSFYVAASVDGVVSESRYAFDAGLVNSPLPFDVFVAGADARVTTYHSILESGEERCAAIRACIHSGIPVSFAMPVDRAYEALFDDSVYQGRTGKIVGGHDQLIIGYDETSFEVLNSWGIGFAGGGVSRIAASYIGSDEVSDLMCCDVAPGGVS